MGEKNGLRRAYLDSLNDANKAAFYHCRQKCKTEEIRGKHTFLQHKDRRQNDPPDLQSEPKGVQGRRLDDPPVRSGDMGRLSDLCQEAQPLPAKLPSQNTEAAIAGQDPVPGILSIHVMLRQMQLR
nr:unnamed protein product [Spirometra erinaceieuropaei]